MRLVSFVFALLAMMLVVGCGDARRDLHAVVDQQQRAFDDLPVYPTVQAALDAAPDSSDAPHRILIRAGEYREKLRIDKPYIHLLGEGMEQTRIHYDDFAGRSDGEGGNLGTFRSYTVSVTSTDVQFHSLSIENRFDFVANDALPKDHPDRVNGTQAVALHLDKGSDRVLARDVQLLGHQDTLYMNGERAWFDKSRIAGNVDFIFGAGNALFTDSDIVTRARGRQHETHGYVTAPSTDIHSEFGFTFLNSRLIREAGVPDNSTALGRPWHPTTTFDDGRYADPDAIGKAVFIGCHMEAHIKESGWDKMGGTAPDGGKMWFYPEDSRFFEYGSEGPGAQQHEQRRHLSEAEVKRYRIDTIFGDWVPEE